jgi:hypothetical protein
MELEYVNSWNEFKKLLKDEFCYYVSSCVDIKVKIKSLEKEKKIGKLYCYPGMIKNLEEKCNKNLGKKQEILKKTNQSGEGFIFLIICKNKTEYNEMRFLEVTKIGFFSKGLFKSSNNDDMGGDVFN